MFVGFLLWLLMNNRMLKEYRDKAQIKEAIDI